MNFKDMDKTTTTTNKRVAGKKKHIVIILAVLLVAAAGAAFYFYKKSLPVQSSGQASREEIKALGAKVGRLIVLPRGEDPTVATVVEPEKLIDQPFFANAQKGDKVLIYAGAKKAILYNPESNKIIEVAPVNIGDLPAATATVSPATTTAPKKK